MDVHPYLSVMLMAHPRRAALYITDIPRTSIVSHLSSVLSETAELDVTGHERPGLQASLTGHHLARVTFLCTRARPRHGVQFINRNSKYEQPHQHAKNLVFVDKSGIYGACTLSCHSRLSSFVFPDQY